MNVTRKDFLAVLSAGAAAAALAPGALLAASAKPLARKLQESVGKTFRVQSENGWWIDMVLTGYQDAPSRDTTQFTLTFESQKGERLAQGTYAIDAPSGGISQIFLVPISVVNGKVTYRADFNLLKSLAVAPAN